MAGLAQILAYLFQIIGRITVVAQMLQTLVNIINEWRGQSDNVARESVPFAIDVATNGTSTILNDLTFGNEPIRQAIDYLRYDTRPDALPDVYQVYSLLANQPLVTLPETPPPGYGGGGESPWLSNLETYDWCPID